MNKLNARISKNGCIYVEMQRYLHEESQRTVALYSVHRKSDNRIIGYETFIIPIRKKPITTPTNVVLPAGEKFPGNEEFGKVVKGYHCGGVNGHSNGLIRFEQLKKYLIDGKSKTRLH